MERKAPSPPRNMFDLPDDTKKTIVDFYQNRHSRRVTAHAFNVSEVSLKAYLNQLNIDKNKGAQERFFPIDRALELKNKGLSNERIGDILGYGASTIGRRLRGHLESLQRE